MLWKILQVTLRRFEEASGQVFEYQEVDFSWQICEKQGRFLDVCGNPLVE
jgi:hypothetical protein